jgi:hypothetical protein
VVFPCLVSIDALAGVEQTLSMIERAAVSGLRDCVVVVLGHDGCPEDAAVSAGAAVVPALCAVDTDVDLVSRARKALLTG